MGNVKRTRARDKPADARKKIKQAGERIYFVVVVNGSSTLRGTRIYVIFVD